MTWKTRILVDTNILFSGIVFSGLEAHLFDLARAGIALLLIPDWVVREAIEIMERKMPEFSGILKDVLNRDYIIKLPPPPRELILKARGIIRDPKDVVILASALDAKPDYMVTGDKDFHTPEIKTVVPVISTREAIEKLLGER